MQMAAQEFQEAGLDPKMAQEMAEAQFENDLDNIDWGVESPDDVWPYEA